jgi:probable glucuronoxylan glucuronosyltransferase IRX7
MHATHFVKFNNSTHINYTRHLNSLYFPPPPSQEDAAIANGTPESTLLQTFGVNGQHVCQDVEHVLIPPHVPPQVALELPEPDKSPRDIFAFFRGKMELHPKNISGRFYSK